MEISRNQWHYITSISEIKNRAKCIKCLKEGLFHVIVLFDLLVEIELRNSMLIIHKNVTKTSVKTINFVWRTFDTATAISLNNLLLWYCSF